MRRLLPWLVAAGLLALAAPAAGYEIGTRHDLSITMRDGTILRADVFYPASPDGRAAPGPFPVLVSETPYDRQATTLGTTGNGVTGYDPYLVSRGYIQAVVDVRGTGTSGGTFVLFGPQETADSVEVIHWAAGLPGSSGVVGMTGQSYLGIVQLNAAAAIGPNSPLKAIFPITAANDPYREIVTSGGILNIESDAALGVVYGGLAMLAPFLQAPADPTVLATLAPHAGVLSGFTTGTIANVVANGDLAYDESFWQARAPGPGLTRIVANGIPAYLVDGLWDVYQEGAPLNYAALQNASVGRPATAPMLPAQPVTGRYQLLVKNTYHTNIESQGLDLEPVKLAWFDRWLKGRPTGIDATTTPLHVVQPDGTRLDAATYPLPQAPPRPYYLGAGATLEPRPPTRPSGADRLLYTGGSLPCDRATQQWALGAGQLVLDQFRLQDPCTRNPLPQSLGPGSVTFRTAPFTQPTLLAGPIDATLFATATTADTEWVVELADLAPDGTATDLTQGALLGSFRAVDPSRSWTTPDGRRWLPYHPFSRASLAPVQPGRVTRYDVDVRPTFATLAAGHRLQVTVLTAQTPHLLPIPSQQANLAGGVYALQRNSAAASYLELPLAPAGAAGAASTRLSPACAARRVSIRLGRTVRVLRVSATVDGRRVRARRTGRSRVLVSLPRMPRHRPLVVVRVREPRGRLVTITRRYRACRG